MRQHMLPDTTTMPTSLNSFSVHRKESGFTLIEIVIAAAIVSIIMAIAVPSYTNFITQANRTDAINFLSEVAGEQQRYFSENNQYATKMSELGYGDDDTATSPEAYYKVEISNKVGVASGYLLTATPVAGGKQAKDSQCKAFTLSSTGVKANTGGSDKNCW